MFTHQYHIVLIMAGIFFLTMFIDLKEEASMWFIVNKIL